MKSVCAPLIFIFRPWKKGEKNSPKVHIFHSILNKNKNNLKIVIKLIRISKIKKKNKIKT